MTPTSSRATSGDSADSAISKSLIPPGRAGGLAFDQSRTRNFADVMKTLSPNVFKIFLEESDPSERASEFKVIVAMFVAAGVRGPTMDELRAEWTRRQNAAKTENGAPPPGRLTRPDAGRKAVRRWPEMSTPTRTRHPDTAPEAEPLEERLQRLAAFERTLWDGVPEVLTARARVGRLNAATATIYEILRGGQGDLPAVVATALNSALDGGQVDAGALRRDLTAAFTANQAAESAAATLAALGEQVRNDLAVTEQNHADTALTRLHDTLEDLVGASRELVVTADADDGDDLAGVGRSAVAGVLLARAATIHDRLRHVQQGLSASPQFGDAAEMVRSHGIVRDPSRYEPFATALRGPEAVSDRTKLPDLAREGGVTLLRVVAADPSPWCPTRSELRAAADDMTTRVEQARYRVTNPDSVAQREDSTPAPVIRGDGLGVSKSVPSRLAKTGPPSIPSRTLGAGVRQRR